MELGRVAKGQGRAWGGQGSREDDPIQNGLGQFSSEHLGSRRRPNSRFPRRRPGRHATPAP